MCSITRKMHRAISTLLTGRSSGLATQLCCNLRSSSGSVQSCRSISSFSSFSKLLSPMASTPSRLFKQFRATSASSDENLGPLSSPPSASGNYLRQIKFCSRCGGVVKHDIPDGDERTRAICTVCGRIDYRNPKMVVGCLIAHNDNVLLCKRKIEPSSGLWTLPAGYMEIGESAAEGAIRETREEANAEVEVISPFSLLDMPLIGQTYMMFLAKLKELSFSPGPETEECQLFPLDDIPVNSLAFSSMLITLDLYLKDLKAGEPKFHYGVINISPGTAPSDIHAFTLDRYMRS